MTKKTYFCIIAFFLLSILFPFEVRASDIDVCNPRVYISTSSMGVEDLCDKVNEVSQEAGGFDFLSLVFVKNSAKDDEYYLYINCSEYQTLDITDEDRQEIILTTLNAVRNSNNLSGQTRSRVYNFIVDELKQLDQEMVTKAVQLDTDTRDSFNTAYSWFKPFSGGLSTVLGVIAFALFMFLTLTILVDISYLVIPPVTVLLTPSSGGKAKFISNEAHAAMLESEAKVNESSGVLGIYLRRKAWQIVLLSVCILYLIGGKIIHFLGIGIDFVQGMVG